MAGSRKKKKSAKTSPKLAARPTNLSPARPVAREGLLRKVYRRKTALGVALVLALALAGLIVQLRSSGPVAAFYDPTSSLVKADIKKDLAQTESSIHALVTTQEQSEYQAVDRVEYVSLAQSITDALALGQLKTARMQLQALHLDYAAWKAAYETHRLNLAAEATIANGQAALIPLSGRGQIPILFYHYTPTDFDAQLTHLETAGYTTITPDQLNSYLRGVDNLPSKPVLITFDDGYSDQLKAFALLQKHHMKATFYVIIGGATSRWCIGIERKFDQGYPCGDSYLNWNEIKTLDASGLITIGSHTLDHLALGSRSADIQREQIFDSKKILEDELGHPVTTFSYPYGSFNATTVALVQEAGYTTAVSTIAGVGARLDNIYTLPRIRDAMKLP